MKLTIICNRCDTKQDRDNLAADRCSKCGKSLEGSKVCKVTMGNGGEMVQDNPDRMPTLSLGKSTIQFNGDNHTSNYWKPPHVKHPRRKCIGHCPVVRIKCYEDVYKGICKHKPNQPKQEK